jgi:hypothetical protein
VVVKVQQEHQAQQALVEHKVQQVQKVLKELMDQQEHQAHQVQVARKVHKVLKALLELQVTLAP